MKKHISGSPLVVRVCSHRARHRLQNLIGAETQGYFSWDRKGEWRACPPEFLERALAIKGIRRAVFADDMRRYIDW